MKGYVSEQALAAYAQLVAETQGLNFSEEETYDFTRCVRPNGSAYGTGGRCRKGTQMAKIEAVKKTEPAEPDVGKSSSPSRSGAKVKVFKPDPGVAGERARKKLANLLSEYTKLEQDHYAKFAKSHKLSDVELGSVLHYSANGYIAMNILMRGRKPPEGAYKGAGGAKSGPVIANEAIVGLQSAMKKLPKYEGDVQRGIRVSREEVDKFFKVGGIYSDPAVQSSSAGKARSNESYGTVFGNRAIDYNKATAKGSAQNTALNTVGVTLRISGDHGGRYLGRGSAAKGEEEVLIPPGQPFKVRKISKMPMHIIVELEAVSS
jgi:hypothetical protein